MKGIRKTRANISTKKLIRSIFVKMKRDCLEDGKKKSLIKRKRLSLSNQVGSSDSILGLVPGDALPIDSVPVTITQLTVVIYILPAEYTNPASPWSLTLSSHVLLDDLAQPGPSKALIGQPVASELVTHEATIHWSKEVELVIMWIHPLLRHIWR